MSINRQAGMTLIELVMAITIVSIGLAGVMLAFTTVVKSSADPMVHKQMLAIAEEMMEEITLKPYAVNGVAPVNAPTSCGLAAAARNAFDDVSDYNNYSTTGICYIDGSAVPGLSGYNVSVRVDPSFSLGTLSSPHVKRVSVSVQNQSTGEYMNLYGWRTDYAS